MKLTPEEERLATCARLYGDHPENTAAWSELRKAALKLAASLGVTPSSSGRKPRSPPQTAAEVAVIRQDRKARNDDKRRRRAEWEAAQRRGGT